MDKISLLKTINHIDDVVMESEFQVYDSLCKNYFKEMIYDINTHELIMESSNTGKNKLLLLWEKIIKSIKHIIRMIKTKIEKLTRFKGKGENKTIKPLINIEWFDELMAGDKTHEWISDYISNNRNNVLLKKQKSVYVFDYLEKLNEISNYFQNESDAISNDLKNMDNGVIDPDRVNMLDKFSNITQFFQKTNETVLKELSLIGEINIDEEIIDEYDVTKFLEIRFKTKNTETIMNSWNITCDSICDLNLKHKAKTKRNRSEERPVGKEC